MLKRCLLAVIVALLVTSSQIAAAEDYDWSKAPRIGTKAELARYIENERRNGNTIFPVVLTNGLIVYNQSELGILCNSVSNSFIVNLSLDSYGFGSGRILFRIREFPGTLVANAYLSSNQQQAWLNLNHEEQELYNVAVGIVDKVNKLSSEREKARYIHDEICKHVKEWKSHTNEDAIGALVIGITNCNGFTDAFYMLCRMAGLNVGRIGGTIDNGKTPHAWNWIDLDGKTYCVDVTLDDSTNSDNWFLKTRAHMEKTHSCEWEIIPNLQ